MTKVLILAGDAAEDLETMFIKYRLAEADYEPHVAAPTMRPIKLVVHDFEPDWDTYVDNEATIILTPHEGHVRAIVVTRLLTAPLQEK